MLQSHHDLSLDQQLHGLHARLLMLLLLRLIASTRPTSSWMSALTLKQMRGLPLGCDQMWDIVGIRYLQFSLVGKGAVVVTA